MAVAVFDYAAWAARYPEFEGRVDASRAASFFAEAGLYLDNTNQSRVQDVGARLMLLNMVVAHLAALSGALEANGQPTGLVGHVTLATQGSVSVSTHTGLIPGSAVWWNQTPYGLSFWAATARFRSASYRAVAQPQFERWRR